jgi:hypothetical protein
MSTPTIHRSVSGLLAVVGCVLALTSCADLAQTGSGPTYLVIDGFVTTAGGRTLGGGASLESDVVVKGSVFTDSATATIRNVMKNTLSTTAPSPHSDVTLRQYRVRFRRTDGRNREGVDVPYGFDGGVTVTIPAAGSAQVAFDLLRPQSKLEPPLSTLVGAGGALIISMIAEVTFYGSDQAGNDVSVSGTIDVKVADFGDS